jgi:hypothetical protein
MLAASRALAKPTQLFAVDRTKPTPCAGLVETANAVHDLFTIPKIDTGT